MDAEAAEEKVGIGGESKEPEYAEHPEAAYDFYETEAKADTEPIGDQQNQDRQNGQQIDNAVNIEELAQPVSRSVQSGDIFNNEKQDDDNLDFP